MKVSDLLREIVAFWGNPSEQDLPQEDALSVVNREVNARLMDMQLSDKNYLAKLSPILYAGYNGNNRAVEVPIADFSAPVRIESRSKGSQSEGDWEEETLLDYGAWGDAQNRPINGVAFSGGVPGGLLMMVNRPASQREFRILYETGGISLAGLTSTLPRMQESFRPVLFYGAAAECGMMLAHLDQAGRQERDKKHAHLMMKYVEAKKAWDKWLLMNRSQAVTYREPFNESRLPGNDWRWLLRNSGSDGTTDNFNTHIHDGGTP